MTVAALAAYGGYRLAKSGKLDKFAEIGKQKINELFKATPHISKKYRIQKKNTRQISRV